MNFTTTVKRQRSLLFLVLVICLSYSQASAQLNLVSLNPAANANGVARDADIVMTFDSDVDAGTLSAANIAIRGEQTGRLNGVFSGGGTTTITFNPDADFKPGEIIRITLSTGLMNTLGSPLAESVNYRFIAGATAAPNMPAFLGEQPPFTTSANFANKIHAVDVDGDGDIDAAAPGGNNDILWYENDGSLNFNEHSITSTSTFLTGFIPVDLDDDGNMDFVAGSADFLAWYQNDGSQNFAESTLSTTVGSMANLYVVDMNGDTHMDIVTIAFITGSTGTRKIAWYENDGSQNFTEHVITTANGSAAYPIDMEGDGDIDLVVVHRNYALNNMEDRLAWYENDGSENFTEHVIEGVNRIRADVHAADIDDDGDVDILEGGALDYAAWYENDGNQNFTVHQLSTLIDQTTSVHITDLDGDGDQDFVLTEELIDAVVFHMNDGSENFTPIIITDCANLVRGFTAADLDGDGDLDGLSASAFDDKLTWYRNAPFVSFDVVSTNPIAQSRNAAVDTDIVLEMNQNIASFSVQDFYVTVTSETRGEISGTLSASGSTLTFDPDNDLVPGEIIRMTVFRKILSESGAQFNNGGYSLEFTVATNAAPSTPPFFLEQVILDNTSTGEIVYVAAADVDSDGNMDLVTISDGTGAEVAWHQNDGAGNFTSNQIFAPTTGATSVAAQDVNGDGDIDVIVTYGGILELYENDGSQNFNVSGFPLDNTGVGEGYNEVMFVDVNNDGRMDWLTAIGYDQGTPTSQVSFYEVEVEGFGETQIASTLQIPNGIYGADIDRDGDIDMLSWSATDPTIGWYENNGFGIFTESLITSSLTPPMLQVFPADLNGDGAIDFVACTADGLAWYINDGSQNFTEQIIDNTTIGITDVYAADVDGDGDNDIIGVGQDLGTGENFVFLFENDGTGTFTENRYRTTSTDLSNTYVVDMDGDGDLDILAASRAGTKAMWFENTIAPTLTLTLQPLDATICVGVNASFTVEAGGDSGLTYQWQEDSGSGFVNLTDGGIYSNTTAATLDIIGVTTGLEGYQYRCQVTGFNAPLATSNPATLTVDDIPTITTQPQSLSANVGDNVSFTLGATSNLPLSYIWEKDNIPISGATTATYSISSVTLADAGDYVGFAVNNCGNVTSSAATLTVQDGGGVIVYNAVSPNGDNQHDFLEITNIHQYPSNKVQIFNRWGDLVYEVNGYDNNNVTFTGTANKGLKGDLPAGTYYYSINLNDGSSRLTGYLVLSR